MISHGDGEVPDDWRKVLIVPLHKGKGNKNDCNNYRDKFAYCARTSVWKNLDREVDGGY